MANRQQRSELLEDPADQLPNLHVMAHSPSPHSSFELTAAHRFDPSAAALTCCQPKRTARVAATLMAMAIAAAQLAPAQAHDVWLAPATPATPEEGALQIGLFIGEHGRSPEALPINPSRLERLWLRTALGEQEIAVADSQVTLSGADPAHGTRTLAYIGKPALSVLPAPEFDDYLREEHLQSILLQRQGTADARHAADSSMVSERYSRSLKLLLANAGQALIDCPVGLPLELSVLAADDAEVLVLATFRGQPLAGLWIDRGAADGSSLAQGVTDDNGRVALPRSDGDWVVQATHMVADDDTPADWRSWWATTTFRLSAEGVGGCEESSR